MTAQEKVFDALKNLGEDVSYADASKWIKKHYGDGVSDASFYNSRRVYRERIASRPAPVEPATNKVAPVAAVPQQQPENKVTFTEKVEQVAPQQVVVNHDITLTDLQKVNDFAKQVGGRDKLRAVLNALDQLA